MHSPAISDEWLAVKDFPVFQCSKEADSHDPDKKIANNDPDFSIDILWNPEEKAFRVDYMREDQKQDGVCSDKPLMRMFTHEFLRNTHDQLSFLLCGSSVLLPTFPVNGSGLWSFFSFFQVSEEYVAEIRQYLSSVRTVLGEEMFLDVFFDTRTPASTDIYEDLAVLNRKAYADEVEQAEHMLDEVISLREGSVNMLDMMTLYDLEDEVLTKLDVARAVLFNFDSQPFMELRELARQNIVRSATQSYDSKEDDKLSEWKIQMRSNEECLADLRLEYFQKCFDLLVDGIHRIEEDRNRFSPADFEASKAGRRLITKQKECCQLKLQMLRLRKKKLQRRVRVIAEEVCQIEETTDMEISLKKLEKRFFDSQMKLFDLNFEILAEEEQFERLQMKQVKLNELEALDKLVKDQEHAIHEALLNISKLSANGEMTDEEAADKTEGSEEGLCNEQDEEDDQFYDAPVDIAADAGTCLASSVVFAPDVLTADFMLKLPPGTLAQVCPEASVVVSNHKKKKDSIAECLSKAFRKRAWMRNKRRALVSDWCKKSDAKKEAEEWHKRHHGIHMKREKDKQKLEEKKEFLQEQRQRTLERLQQYKQKNPSCVQQPPPRYSVPLRRTRQKASSGVRPFVPGGPASVSPGSALELRIKSAKRRNAPVDSKKAKSEKGVGKKSLSNGISEVTTAEGNASHSIACSQDALVDLPLPPVSSNTSPPPPPPPPPPPVVIAPPPPPPPPPQVQFSSSDSSKNSPKISTSRPSKEAIKPAGPLNNNVSSSKISFDLNNIISARQKLRRVSENERDFGQRSGSELSDVGASLLRNTLHKMRKHMMQSSDDEGECDDNPDNDGECAF